MPLYLKYYFWLLVVSAAVFLLERLAAARREQEVVRDDLVQDLVWMVFNTQYLSWMLALASVWLVGWLDTTLLHLGLPTPQSARLLSDWPLWLQAVTVLVVEGLCGVERAPRPAPPSLAVAISCPAPFLG
jgi:hypothetical protein